MNRSLWASALAWGAYPSIVFGSFALALLGIQEAWLPTSQWVVVVVFLSGFSVACLEWLTPDRPRRATPRMLWLDLLHNVFSAWAPAHVVRALAFGVFVAVSGMLSEVLGQGLWPTGWPLVVQAVLTITVGAFGSYWAHRLLHHSELMWRIHALHHSPSHLYLLASGRTHPLNAIFVHGLQTAPVICMGAGPDVIALAALFTATTGFLQHCNARLHTEWLNWLLATPDLHRTHHSVDLDESNTNFSPTIILWDVVFGTRLPGRRPQTYGVGGVRWPETYLGHMATPFTYGQISTSASGVTVSNASTPLLLLGGVQEGPEQILAGHDPD